MPRPVLSNSRSQLSRILSNTGCVSASAPPIACSTSAVAVCCLKSASVVSLDNENILDRDDGLVGKGLQQSRLGASA